MYSSHRPRLAEWRPIAVGLVHLGLMGGAFAAAVASAHGGNLAFRASEWLSAPDAARSLFSAWNPTTSRPLLRPGLKILFFGSATGCHAANTPGPTVSVTGYSLGQIAQYAGLISNPISLRKVIGPGQRTEGCAAFSRNRPGSFVVLGGRGQKLDVVGEYTTAGPDTRGRKPLIDVFDGEGQDGIGANGGIIGEFVVFRMPSDRRNSVRLWPNVEARNTRTSAFLDVSTVQTVASISLGNAARNVTAVKQAKQELLLTFLNPDCRSASQRPVRLCQIQYLFTLCITRTGVLDWGKVPWFQTAHLWLDPMQGKMPVVDGPVGKAREATVDDTRRVSLFTSEGAQTRHGVFRNAVFRVRIDFSQFSNALRLATATELHKPMSALTERDIARLFGSSWNDPVSWSLLDVEVGQEIYDPYATSEAYIGGNFREIEIHAEPQA